jgi:hypothetical protein
LSNCHFPSPLVSLYRLHFQNKYTCIIKVIADRVEMNYMHVLYLIHKYAGTKPSAPSALASNKRNSLTDLPPFLTRQTWSHEIFTLLRMAAALQHFLKFLTHSCTQKHVTWDSGLFQSASRLYPVRNTWVACWKSWNNITALALSDSAV